jgi:hypothetical protein
MSGLIPIDASPGDKLTLQTKSKGNVTNYYAVLERFDTGAPGGPEDTWNRTTLEGIGGKATLANAKGYNVIIFPNLGQNGSIEATLKVGKQTDKQTISTNSSAGWRIFIF